MNTEKTCVETLAHVIKKEVVALLLFFLIIVVGIFLTQFYFLGFGIELGTINFFFSKSMLLQALIGLSAIALTAFGISLLRKNRRRNQALKLQAAKDVKEAEEKKKAEAKIRDEKEAAEKSAKRKEMEARIKEIAEGDFTPKWWEVLHLYRDYGRGICYFRKFASKIFLLSLTELVTVSRIKRQIVWQEDFRTAISLFDDLADTTYSDDELKPLVTYLDDYLASIEDCKEFDGYERLIREMKSKGDTIFPLLNQKVAA